MTTRATRSPTSTTVPAATSKTPQAQSVPDRIVDSSALLGGQKSMLIHHLGDIYRLQQTRHGKLILTK